MSFLDIIQSKLPKLGEILQEHPNYLAHIDPDQNRKEKLDQHSKLVIEYAFTITKEHKLEASIQRLIDKVLEGTNPDIKEDASNFLWTQFYSTIVFHDFGKINENFQVRQMSNNKFKERSQSPFRSTHSELSTALFLWDAEKKIKHLFQDRKSEWKTNSIDIVDFLYIICFFLSYSILKHHSKTLISFEQLFEKEFHQDDKYDLIKEYCRCFGKYFYQDKKSDLESSFLKNIDKLKQIFEYNNPLKIFYEQQQEFALFSLIRLNFSLLTASDYMATSHFMGGFQSAIDQFGILNKEQKEKLVKNFETTQKYNEELYANLKAPKNELPNKLDEKSPDNLNTLRLTLAREVVGNIRKNISKQLFYIEAPTGSGKTNLSMVAITECLRQDLKENSDNIQKIFYVFPFTTLITQTYKSLEESFSLENSCVDMLELHSKAGFSEKQQEEEKNDGLYGKNKINYIHYTFANYPICLLSHVRFFNILKSKNKDDLYLLHRLSNSLVIIDEIQSYPPEIWDKMIYFIEQYATLFNMKFILMSATLPKIDRLLERENNIFVELVPKAKEDYFQNVNFATRVEYDFSLLEQDNLKIEDLADKSYNIVKDFYQNNNDSVHVVIEFIFKQSASKFYSYIKENNLYSEFDEIFVLSGTILEPRRKQIINYLKGTKDKNNHKNKVLLVTTQVIEAGVDIDMDIGFKNVSIIDSDEQLAGRINRNASKSNSKLYLFCSEDDPNILYGNDLRYKVVHYSESEYQDILKQKNFDALYKKVIDKLKATNHEMLAKDTLDEYKKCIAGLRFDNVDNKCQIIPSGHSNYSVFIPIDIPLRLSDSSENMWVDKNLYSFAKEYSLMDEQKQNMIGKEVWDLYKQIIENKKVDFIEQRIELKYLQGILSNFTFSVYGNLYEKLKPYGKEEYGFLYLSSHDEIYDYCSGIDSSKLSGCIII